MGGAHSREDLELLDSDEEQQTEGEENHQDAKEKTQRSAERGPKTPSSVEDVETKLKALKLKYASPSQSQTQISKMRSSCTFTLVETPLKPNG